MELEGKNGAKAEHIWWNASFSLGKRDEIVSGDGWGQVFPEKRSSCIARVQQQQKTQASLIIFHKRLKKGMCITSKYSFQGKIRNWQPCIADKKSCKNALTLITWLDSNSTEGKIRLTIIRQTHDCCYANERKCISEWVTDVIVVTASSKIPTKDRIMK